VTAPARQQYVGQALKRREDHRLLLGRGQYLADIKLPEMLHMAILRSPVAHARITHIDTARARECAGVEAVLTFDDIRMEVAPLPCFGLPPDSKPALPTALASAKVRYVGEPVAVVVAADRYLAEDAIGLLDVRYEILDAVVNVEAATAPDAPLLYGEFGTNVAATVVYDTGDVDQAFAQADHIYKETFRVHRSAPSPMETRGVIADADPSTRHITLWSSTQFPHIVRGLLSSVISLPESHIRVIAPDVGGGFGVKAQLYPEEVLAPLLSLRLSRPVKWVEDRREHLIAATHAREQLHQIEVAVSADGMVTGMRANSYTDNGAAIFTAAPGTALQFAQMLRGPYRIPNYHAKSQCVLTNKTPLSIYRGGGHPQAAFCMERIMDIVAHDLGIDPADLRKRNMLTAAELPADRGIDTQGGKIIYDSGDYPACLDAALRLIDYHSFPEQQALARNAGRYLGLGMCCYVEQTAPGPYESASVRVESSGKVTVLTGSSPQGQGHETAFSQLVADELEIDIDDITVLHGDTDQIPDGIGTFASRSAAVGGAAARIAARQVREKALRLAAGALETDERDLVWANGAVHVRGAPERAVSLGTLAQLATAWSQFGDGKDFSLAAGHRYQPSGIAFAYGTHIAIVEVDSRTGQVAVLRYGVVADSGRVINPAIVEGQIHGGVAQGIGSTLFEDISYDDASGQPRCASLTDYLLPTARDVPHVLTDHLESLTPVNPYGMKGAGESGVIGAPGAIVNALANALESFGVHLVTDGPYSPSLVQDLIRRAQHNRT
jgi:carbon-monoxide dehydrogenase large subunit